MGSPPDPERVNALSRQLHDSEGHGIEIEFHGLNLSFRTFVVNARALLHATDAFENTFPNPLIGNHEKLLEFSHEVVRLFQNAVASSQAFLEHCSRSVGTRYAGQPFAAEFHAEYSRQIRSAPVCQFVAVIRNFQLHNQSISPVISRAASDPFTGQMGKNQIVLATEQLRLEQPNWLKKYPLAGQYLDALADTLDVGQLFREYEAPVLEFRAWHRTREREINSEALTRSRELREELAKHLPRFITYLQDPLT